jgi:hypothetical protein
MEKYTYHTDPGHGWLEVELAELGELGIADKISPYSYLHCGKVYLEEDMDMTTFYKAKERRGQAFERVEVYKHHTPIRGYSSYFHPDYVSPFTAAWMVTELDLRPSEIIWAFWESVTVIEETAHRLEILYFENWKAAQNGNDENWQSPGVDDCGPGGNVLFRADLPRRQARGTARRDLVLRRRDSSTGRPRDQGISPGPEDPRTGRVSTGPTELHWQIIMDML